MRNKEEYILNFNPEESQDPQTREIFKSRTAQILWCSLKQSHLTDQYFNSTILEVAKEIDKTRIKSYSEFVVITRKLNAQFGVVTIDECMFTNSKVIDNEFWVDIYQAINGKRCFRLKVVIQPQWACKGL